MTATYCETRRQVAAVLLGAVERLGEAGCKLVAVLGGRPRAENGHEPAGEKRANDFAETVLARAGHGLRLERRLLAEDRRVQLLERRRRLDAELLDEHPARLLIGLERLGLPPASIEGEHELAARTLAKGVLAHERFELADELGRPSELELRLDPLLDRGQSQLFETAGLVLRERLVGEVREGRAAPELERFAAPGGCDGRARRARLVQELARTGARRRRPSRP